MARYPYLMKTARLPLTYRTEKEGETIAIAARFAQALTPPVMVALRGDLGAGKTAFARALIRALPGVAEDEDVPSPTFTLVQTYDADVGPVFHFDLYRIEHPAELRELGWDDALDEGLALVEWPNKAGSELPGDRIDVEIRIEKGTEARLIEIKGVGLAASQVESLRS